MNAPEIDNAAFSLEAGGVSDVVQSAFGFHVVKVIERLPARTQSFEEVSADMARGEAIAEAATERANRLVEAISTEIEAGKSLRDAAANLEIETQFAGPLGRRVDGFIPGLGGAPEILNAAFALREEAPTSPRIFAVGSQRVFIQLLERNSPEEEELQATVEARREDLLNSKRNRLVQEWVDRRRIDLEKSGELLVNSQLVLSDS